MNNWINLLGGLLIYVNKQIWSRNINVQPLVCLICIKIIPSRSTCLIIHTHTNSGTDRYTRGIDFLKDKETFRAGVCLCNSWGIALRKKGSSKWVRCYIWLVTSVEEWPTKPFNDRESLALSSPSSISLHLLLLVSKPSEPNLGKKIFLKLVKD